MSIFDFFKRRSALLQQTSRLRAENRQLKTRLDAAVVAGDVRAVGVNSAGNVYRPQDDFASALGSAVDSLQANMARMSNPVSDFAVREVSLQAKVSLDITPLGTLAYRFVNPADRVEPEKISSLSLTIVPVPKQNGAATLDAAGLDSQVGVEELPGLGKDRRERLRRQDIYTVGEFLQAGTRARSAVQLAALLGVDRLRLSEWMAHAQLLMLEGVDGQIASVLHDAGVRSLDDLATLSPEEVLARYERQAGKSGQLACESITLARAEAWVKTARAYTGKTNAPDVTA